MTALLRNWIVAAVGTAAFLGAAALLDGPTDAEIEEATAADLISAYAAEREFAALVAKCHALVGPQAEVVLSGISGQEFVCRVKKGI